MTFAKSCLIISQVKEIRNLFVYIFLCRQPKIWKHFDESGHLIVRKSHETVFYI